jgi:hypothetical protein
MIRNAIAFVILAITLAVLISRIQRPRLRLSTLSSLPRGDIVIVQAFDSEYRVGAVSAEHNRAWAQKNGYKYFLYSTLHFQEQPHFMKYHALLKAFEIPGVEGAVYVDGDAIINYNGSRPVFDHAADITFGNEFWWTVAWPNTGYIAARRTPQTTAFLRAVLSSAECAECRRTKCGWLGHRDQGCIDRLLRCKRYRVRAAVAMVQTAPQRLARKNKRAFLTHWVGTKDHGRIVREIGEYRRFWGLPV